jgi:glycosyltransferase involved in cell wall biosynthesis
VQESSSRDGDLRVLSLGFTRDLWTRGSSAPGDTRERMSAYAGMIARYRVVVHSSRRHRLRSPVRFGSSGVGYPTNAFTHMDSWLRMIAICRRLKDHRFHLIQAQDPFFTGMAALLLGRRWRIPVNVCVYGSNAFDPEWINASPLSTMVSPFARYVLRHADSLQVDGRATRRSLVDAGLRPDRIFYKPLIPWNITEFASSRSDHDLRRHLSSGGRFRYIAGFVGRIVKQKNLRLLLDVAERTAKALPDLRFVCVGDGPELGSLRKECAARDLDDRVLWLGTLPHHVVVRLMATIDLFVLTSRFEGFPRVLMEAAAASRPVVTTQVSGTDEAVIDGASGFVIPQGNPDAFAAAIIRLCADPGMRDRFGSAGKGNMMNIAGRYSDFRRQVEIWHHVAALR